MDDITFSTNQKAFPESIARFDKETNQWSVSAALENTIKRSGFEVNLTKTRMHYKDSRQVVTGLIVNKKINVRKEYYKTVRAMTHNLFRNGYFEVPSRISPNDILNEDDVFPESRKNAYILEGMLEHIYQTRNFNDGLIEKDKNAVKTGVSRLYSDFLFLRYFGLLEKPLIICEGPTDGIYLRAAIKSLRHEFTQLWAATGGKFHPLINILRYSSRVQELLALSGGTGDITTFVFKYENRRKRFQSWAPKCPVILVTDNDSGKSKKNGEKGGKNAANAVFSAVGKVSESQPSIDEDSDFFHVKENLYLVKMPHVAGKIETVIEDLFPKTISDIQLDGKRFSKDNEYDKSKFFGKADFASKVVAANSRQISFEGFRPLLERICLVIDDWDQKMAKTDIAIPKGFRL